MSKFKAGDDVVYMLKGKPAYYASVLDVAEYGNRMWVKWYDNSGVETQLMDCDNFELVRKRNEE